MKSTLMQNKEYLITLTKIRQLILYSSIFQSLVKNIRVNTIHIKNYFGIRKLIVGSWDTYQKGWISSDVDTLDITKDESWNKYFRHNSLTNIMAEHVWEHLDVEDGLLAINLSYKYLKKGGKLRIAVPDGYHRNKSYLDYVRPNGPFHDQHYHKVLYNYKKLSKLLSRAGFKVDPLEYWDEKHEFHYYKWDTKDGLIRRSSRFDTRNSVNKLSYTSLIIDGIKP